jgi:hypothetical protein
VSAKGGPYFDIGHSDRDFVTRLSSPLINMTKRAATDDLKDSAKRAKSSNNPFDPSLEKSALSLCKSGSDGSGYISGVVFMSWPRTRKARFNFGAIDNRKTYFFDVELTGACLRYINKLEINPKDVLQIALKGVTIEKTQGSSSPNSLPMVLKYNDGVIIKFIQSRKTTEGEFVVDTWLRKRIIFNYSNERFITDMNH